MVFQVLWTSNVSIWHDEPNYIDINKLEVSVDHLVLNLSILSVCPVTHRIKEQSLKMNNVFKCPQCL